MTIADTPVIIFCGGRGARFDAETYDRPKPMISVAGKPMLHHIIDSFYAQGFREFILPYGYLGHHIAGFKVDAWKYGWFPGATIVAEDTGVDAHVGERLRNVRDVIGQRCFVMTYGDGLSNVKMADVIAKHEKGVSDRIWWGDERPDDPKPAILTLTAVKPASRFGAVNLPYASGLDPWEVGRVLSFREKPHDSWINGGFMVVERRFIDSYLAPNHLTGVVPQLEGEAMSACAEDGFMRAWRHNGYWRCMDTRRDKEQIEADVKTTDGLPWLR